MTLTQWLSWQETQHAKPIDLGLERMRPVLQRMRLEHPPHVVITVAGTNGKGSSVALLEAILLAAGYRVGAYSSPHLLRYNERIRVNGVELSDEELCASFARIDEARGAISLTYFEFGTLAAFDSFQRAGLDVAILEVGLGGRLDAVNLLDADLALVTTIGIDHVHYLGADRDSIGKEKAGIMRPQHPVVCGDPDPPQSLLAHANALGAPLYRLGRDFGYSTGPAVWSWWAQVKGVRKQYDALPQPRLRGAFQLQNAASVIMVLEQLGEHLPVQLEHIHCGLTTVNLCGRFQVISAVVTRIFDVAHNPHAAQVLAESLRDYGCVGRTRAVFAMLADKDILGVVRIMHELVDVWYVAGLALTRGASSEDLAQQLRTLAAREISTHNTVTDAYVQALADAQPGDRVVVFGSFYTVAEALRIEAKNSN